MQPLLSPAGREALRDFARAGTLVALDYDGTLAPIVPHPPDAHLRPATRELLARLCRSYPVLVLSGRARADVLRFLDGLAPLEVIGSHGADRPGPEADAFAGDVARWRAALAAALRDLAGVTVEDKRLSLAVHYRHARDAEGALARIGQAVAALDGARSFGGKKVVNVVPRAAPDKGAALLAAMARAGCERAVFAGDDDTDEDVFRLDRPRQILAVRVGPRDDSAAAWSLRDQGEVDALLRALLSPI